LIELKITFCELCLSSFIIWSWYIYFFFYEKRNTFQQQSILLLLWLDLVNMTHQSFFKSFLFYKSLCIMLLTLTTCTIIMAFFLLYPLVIISLFCKNLKDELGFQFFTKHCINNSTFDPLYSTKSNWELAFDNLIIIPVFTSAREKVKLCETYSSLKCFLLI